MQIKAGTLAQQLEERRAIIDKCIVADQRKRFRVGDRVRYRDNIGIIDNIVIDGGANMYDVRFISGGRWSYRSIELHRIKSDD